MIDCYQDHPGVKQLKTRRVTAANSFLAGLNLLARSHCGSASLQLTTTAAPGQENWLSLVAEGEKWWKRWLHGFGVNVIPNLQHATWVWRPPLKVALPNDYPVRETFGTPSCPAMIGKPVRDDQVVQVPITKLGDYWKSNHHRQPITRRGMLIPANQCNH